MQLELNIMFSKIGTGERRGAGDRQEKMITKDEEEEAQGIRRANDHDQHRMGSIWKCVYIVGSMKVINLYNKCVNNSIFNQILESL